MFPRIPFLFALVAGPAICLTAAPPAAHPPQAYWSLEYQPGLATLGVVPCWSRLDTMQETISRATFESLLDTVYASAPGGWKPWITLNESHAAIRTHGTGPDDRYLLRFSATDNPVPPRYWREPSAIPQAADPALPLTGLRIALDPGHMGGEWARFEERFFQINGEPPVQEGDLVLAVAQLLRDKLSARGATVLMVRSKPGPVTLLKPADVDGYTVKMLKNLGIENPPAEVFQKSRNRVFSVNAEIRARAALVNNTLLPDLVIALHLNGEPWGKATAPEFSPANHLHVLIHGCLEPAELANDDERLEMIIKLLQRTHEVELAVGEKTAANLATATGLPPFTYHGGNARAAGTSPYLWSRNLLASRLYQCPVVYLEPHVMNNALTYERIRAGGYAGKKQIGGVERLNIFEEYAAATALAVEQWFVEARRTAPPPAPAK